MAEPPSSTDGAGAGVPRFPGRGFRLADYEIVDTLGHGSMATVFLARDASGHEVALKIFQEGPGVSPTLLERFKREAEASKKLRKHPHVMKVYETGQDGPYHFIAMEPIKNSKTLEDCIEMKSLGIQQTIELIVKIARALHYAHTHHIVHRDVKPSNIMIDEFGEPLLTDFGVAALIDWPSFTMSGALTGTPLYMSPEQARAERVGPASDIYALGVVLFEALTGQLPYTCQHAAPVKTVLEAVKNEAPQRPRALNREITPELEAVVVKALAKDPAQRYSDAEEMALDLERVLSGMTVHARRYSYTARLAGWARRRERLFAAAAVLLGLAGWGAWYFRQEILRERYEKLLGTAQLRNFTAQVVARTNQPPEETVTSLPGAWHAIRQGRRCMVAEDWTAALAEFQSAINFSQGAHDARTAAIAQLEQARCEILLRNTGKARSVYREIMASRDASPSVADFAQLECLLLVLAEGDRAEAVEILNARKLPAAGPLRDAIACLAGEVDARQLRERLGILPARLQNDACLAVALRARLDGSDDLYREDLKRCLQLSTPPSDWPAPWARSLRADAAR